MFPRSLLFCTLVAGFGTPALSGQTEAVGAGAARCKDYLAAARADARKDIYVQWVSGMITGVAAFSTNVDPHGLTVGGLADDLKRYCKERPADSIFQAAGVLARPYRVAKAYPLGGK